MRVAAALLAALLLSSCAVTERAQSRMSKACYLLLLGATPAAIVGAVACDVGVDEFPIKVDRVEPPNV